nr:MAG TPA: AntA/AntB antirepressor [Caudoviricetes sp.]
MDNIIETTDKTPIEIALGVDENGMTTARKLYEFLELNMKNYSRWFNKNIVDNKFATENEDYIVFLIEEENPLGGRPTRDAKLTAQFAKKLSMATNNEKGEQARDYFVTIEEKAKETALNTQQLATIVMSLADSFKVMQDTVNNLTAIVNKLVERLDKQEEQLAEIPVDDDALTVEEAYNYLVSNGYKIANLEKMWDIMERGKLTRSTKSGWRLPLKKAKTDGFLTVTERTYDNNGTIEKFKETMVTPKGLEYIQTLIAKA